MPAARAASTFAARSSKKTIASAMRRAVDRGSIYVRMRFAQPDLVGGDRKLEELDDSQLVRVALPVQLVRVAQRREAVTGAERFEQLLRSRQHAPRPGRELAEKLRGRQIHVPVFDEPVRPFGGRQLSALELVGVRTFGPALENDFRRRRPSQMLSELSWSGKLHQHASEIEEGRFRVWQTRLWTSGSGLWARQR